MSNLGLCEFREVSMDGKTIHFRTGLPVTFPFIRNTASMPRHKRGTPDTYGQKVEPAGRYMLHATSGHLNPGWTRGVVSFQNPIVLNYGNTSGDAAGWKSRLSKEFGGKVGAALTAKLRSLGYDGIVTGGRHGTDEIVDLNPVRNPKKRMGKILKFPLKRNRGIAAKSFSAPRKTRRKTPPGLRAWFGKSKVTTAKGTPLAVYHGTAKNFSAFEPKLAGSNTRGGGLGGPALFFTDKRSVAAGYTGEEQRGKVMQVYLRIENPFCLNAEGSSWRNVFPEAIYAAHNRGHDGVIVKRLRDTARSWQDEESTVYVVFSPDQVKSAKRNIGDYSKTSSNIYRNPNKTITLTGPQIREILIWEGGGGQINDARIGGPLKSKGLVRAEKASTTHRGWTKSKIIYVSTPLGCKVSKLLHSRTDLPSWRSQVDWGKISVTISEK